MFTVKRTAAFDVWLLGLRDTITRIRLAKRLDKVQRGLFGDNKPVGDGVHELREDFGPGWRMYYVQRGDVLVVMLGGGDKSGRYSGCDCLVQDSGGLTMTKIANLPTFDMAEHLTTEEDVAAYLSLVLEEDDPAELAHALGIIARARGMTEIANASGLTREALYKALRPNSQPRFDTIRRVCGALGVRLVAQPIHA